MMDHEDQGYTRIKDGCFSCRPTFDAKGRPVRPKIVRIYNEAIRRWCWICSKCGVSYGLIPKMQSEKGKV
jgi:hypothetical protein